MRKMLQVWVSVIVFAFIFSLQTIEVKANELVFQENASEIIFNSLQTQPDHSFLKKLYKEVLFMPVWMREKSLSPAAKELFETIRDDGTLNKKGTLYQDNLLLEQRAEEIYTFNGSMAEKLTLEFKISQLYKAYTDYAYFGSINWGAFQARISNLMVNGVSTEWVLHRPEVNPIGIVEKAALGESLKKQLQAAIPTAYHYKKLQKVYFIGIINFNI